MLDRSTDKATRLYLLGSYLDRLIGSLDQFSDSTDLLKHARSFRSLYE